jgi:hypothetical protein
MIPISLLFLIGLRVFRIVKLFQGEDGVELSFDAGYTALFIAHNTSKLHVRVDVFA